MKHFLLLNTIRGKIMVLTASITLIITILTTSVCFVLFQTFLQKNQTQSAEFNLQTVSTQVSSDMNDILYLTKWFCSNRNMLRYLETFADQQELAAAAKKNDQLKTEALTSYNRMKDEFYGTRANDYIIRALITTNNQNNFLQVMTTGDTNHSKAPKIIAANSFFRPLYEAADFKWIGLVQDPLTTAESLPVLPILRPIYNQYSTDILGWTYLSISPAIITDYLKSYPLADDTELYLTIGEHHYLIDQQHLVEIMPDYQTMTNLSHLTLKDETEANTISLPDSSKRTMVTVPLGIDGWYLTEILSQQQLNAQTQVYFILIAAICMVILSLGFLLMTLLNRMINRPVTLIRNKIDAISNGDFSPDLAIEWKHELGEIGRGINALSHNVVTLMNKRVEDEKQKKDLEYQILQSQINPHFLYNTLNSIRWMATIQHADGIAEMTTALARLLKNVSKGTSALIPLKEELELVKDYFLIQQYRYGGSIAIDYQIESEDLYQCKIYRFTLQPMIENALFHGIEPKGTNGHITIRVQAISRASNNDLEISITDDGIGMSNAKIEQVLSDPVGEKQADFFKQIGIQNVNQRIQYEYGKEYGIHIVSELDLFTTMTILVPYINDSNSMNGDNKI